MPPSRFHMPQGKLYMLILQLVSLEPAHGYGIAQRLEQISRSVVRFLMFRSIARVVVPVGVVSVSVLVSLASAQIRMPNPIAEPNPLTATLSIFRSNMLDKIMKSADAMPESKYSYRPTKDVRSFAEILNHVADISYILCSNVKGEANPAPDTAKDSKTA